MIGKKGQSIFLGIMVSILVFITVVQFITPIKDQVVDARDADSLDCGNTSISTGQNASCIIVDWALPYFIGASLAVAIGMISAFGVRKIAGKGKK